MKSSDFEGFWRGDDGAEVNLLQSGDAISGTYTAKVVDPTAPHRGRILVGTADGAVIGFVTSCPEPHRIMSWIGHLIGSEDSTVHQFRASYHTIDNTDSDAYTTKHFTPNTVLFTRISRM